MQKQEKNNWQILLAIGILLAMLAYFGLDSAGAFGTSVGPSQDTTAVAAPVDSTQDSIKSDSFPND